MVVELAGFLSICLVGLITHLRGARVGLGSFAAFLLLVVVVTLVRGDRESLSSALLGALIGLPVLVAALVLHQRREARVGATAQAPPEE